MIVIECKAEIARHKSESGDQYADFAVDDALLYASHLSKDYDVLAIAVSGETQEELKVSHFLHLKGTANAESIFEDKLLLAQNYLEGYRKSSKKFQQDYKILLVYAKQLNEKLHTCKISENRRALLLSCILIALEDDAFKVSYAKRTTSKSLAESLIATASERLKKSNLDSTKLEDMSIQFEFIKADTSLSKIDGLLKSLIDEIDANVNQFIKTHKYFDIVGQLYIKFLQYANSDKSLGIVLTPPHITELFAELAQVNKNSVVYDNCAGTGGFLIAAMKYMIEGAKGDSTTIEKIKSSQLIGTEY